MMTVWPALWPPAYRATMEKFSERTSTILPLPSSPHWAPTMTAVLPFFKVSSVAQDGGHPGRVAGSHTLHAHGDCVALNYKDLQGWCVPAMITRGIADEQRGLRSSVFGRQNRTWLTTEDRRL